MQFSTKYSNYRIFKTTDILYIPTVCQIKSNPQSTGKINVQW